MKTFYFLVLTSSLEKRVVSTSGETYYHAKALANSFGVVLKTLPCGSIAGKR